ncbi:MULTISPECIES: hypothetical protein [unclassified Burkholderia]|uniref:hypothetical protein n=1 Tax=unclassified Burkholderia TaxID=2613784 RepID=UPI002B4BA1FA|nr:MULTISPECIES: hypothetical protein [unclassified Burkholderia]
MVEDRRIASRISFRQPSALLKVLRGAQAVRTNAPTDTLTAPFWPWSLALRRIVVGTAAMWCRHVSAQLSKTRMFRCEDPMLTMLSPHEITTLMMVWDAPDQIGSDREEIFTLLERQLIAFDPLASDDRHIQVTAEGHAVLKAVSRIR